MTRTQLGFLITGIGMIALSCFLIGKAFGDHSRIVVTQMPENQVCQPFRTEADQKAQDKELEELGAKPVMSQMLLKAFKDQSAGKLELIPVSDRYCQEHLGSLRAVRTTTYYAVRKKI